MDELVEEDKSFLISKDEMLAIMSNSFHVMALRYGMERLKNLHDENGWTLAHYVFKASQDLSIDTGVHFLQFFIEYGFDLNKPAFNSKGYFFTSMENVLSRESNRYLLDNHTLLKKHFSHLNNLNSDVQLIDYYYLGNPTSLHLLPFFFERVIEYNMDKYYYNEKTNQKMKILDYAYYLYESLEMEKVQDNLGFTPFLYSLHLNCNNYANYFLNKKSRILNQQLLSKTNEVKWLLKDKMSSLSVDLIEQLDEEIEILNIEKEKHNFEKIIELNDSMKEKSLKNNKI